MPAVEIEPQARGDCPTLKFMKTGSKGIQAGYPTQRNSSRLELYKREGGGGGGVGVGGPWIFEVECLKKTRRELTVQDPHGEKLLWGEPVRRTLSHSELILLK